MFGSAKKRIAKIPNNITADLIFLIFFSPLNAEIADQTISVPTDTKNIHQCLLPKDNLRGLFFYTYWLLWCHYIFLSPLHECQWVNFSFKITCYTQSDTLSCLPPSIEQCWFFPIYILYENEKLYLHFFFIMEEPLVLWKWYKL